MLYNMDAIYHNLICNFQNFNHAIGVGIGVAAFGSYGIQNRHNCGICLIVSYEVRQIQMNLVANTGFMIPASQFGHFETGSNVLLNLELSAAVSVDGMLTYIEV